MIGQRNFMMGRRENNRASPAIFGGRGGKFFHGRRSFRDSDIAGGLEEFFETIRSSRPSYLSRTRLPARDGQAPSRLMPLASHNSPRRLQKRPLETRLRESTPSLLAREQERVFIFYGWPKGRSDRRGLCQACGGNQSQAGEIERRVTEGHGVLDLFVRWRSSIGCCSASTIQMQDTAHLRDRLGITRRAVV